MAESLENLGTISFRLQHVHQDWRTNLSNYSFGPFEQLGIKVIARKLAMGTLEVVIDGTFGWHITFLKPVPPPNVRGDIHVLIQWRFPNIDLFLDGKLAERHTITDD